MFYECIVWILNNDPPPSPPPQTNLKTQCLNGKDVWRISGLQKGLRKRKIAQFVYANWTFSPLTRNKVKKI